MTQPCTSPYIWVTWLSKLLGADDSCVWSSWFRAHFQGFRKGDGSSSDLVRWKMAHTRLLRQITDALRAGGHALATEDQNLFRLTGRSGATLADRPDLIATAPDGSVTVCDANTRSKKASDAAQVMIYLYALAHDPRYRDRRLEGRLVHGDGTEAPVPAGSLDGEFIDGLHDLLGRVTGGEPSECVPSRSECSWCPLTADDCPDRIK